MLQPILNERFSQERYAEITHNNWLFKLSYKSSYQRKNSMGLLIFYGFLINESQGRSIDA